MKTARSRAAMAAHKMDSKPFSVDFCVERFHVVGSSL